MPRTLPWLTDAPKSKTTKSSANASSPAPKRKHDSTDNDDLVDDDLNVIRPATPERKPKKATNRTPSTSPPPAPPDVEYMREGYNGDDIYLMVEDEFLSTAKMYTQHIHHAEYVRLKKLARSRGAGTLNAIARPTDGKTAQSKALRMKLEAKEKDMKIQNGIKKLGDDADSSEEEDEYMYDPQLAGLMTKEVQARKDLSDISKAKSNTRAAAGFVQSPHNVERKKDALIFDAEVVTEDSDDLDGAQFRTTKPERVEADSKSRSKSSNTSTVGESQWQNSTEGPRLFKRFAKPSTHEPRHKSRDFEQTSPSKTSRSADRTSLQPRSAASPEDMKSDSAAQDYLTKRRLEKERKEREEKRKAKKADEIPTFLI